MHLAIGMFAGCTLHHGSYRRNQCNQFARESVVPGADADASFFAEIPPPSTNVCYKNALLKLTSLSLSQGGFSERSTNPFNGMVFVKRWC